MYTRETPPAIRAAFRRLAEAAIASQVATDLTNRRITEFMQELDKERIACGYSITRLGHAANMKKPQYLEAYRTGNAIPNNSTISNLCKVLGIELPFIPQLSVSKPYQRTR